MSEVVTLDDYRGIEEITKLRTGAKHVVIALVYDDSVSTYIPVMPDIDLVYAIQTLSDRRREITDAKQC